MTSSSDLSAFPTKLSLSNVSSEKEMQSLRILIVGVGGAGCTILKNLDNSILEKIDYLAINTDSQALEALGIQNTYLIGKNKTYGLGTGGDPELGREAAESSWDELVYKFKGYNLIIILAALGGGTGGGVSPILSKIASQNQSLVFAFVTLPFSFEGSRRLGQAQASLAALRASADAVIPLSNDLLFQKQSSIISALQAFKESNIWIEKSLSSFLLMQLKAGLINIDFLHLSKMFSGCRGKTLFGFAEATDSSLVEDVLKKLLLCPLLHTPNSGQHADALIVSITGGRDLSMHQVTEVMQVLNQRFSSKENTILGVNIDEKKRAFLEVLILGVIRQGARAPRKEFSIASVAATTNTDIDGNAALEAPQGSAFVSSQKAKLLSKPSSAKQPQQEFEFLLGSEDRGFFENTEKNFYEGQDLDVPTYLRQGIKINL